MRIQANSFRLGGYVRPQLLEDGKHRRFAGAIPLSWNVRCESRGALRPLEVALKSTVTFTAGLLWPQCTIVANVVMPGRGSSRELLAEVTTSPNKVFPRADHQVHFHF
jgi:hypothetical protein